MADALVFADETGTSGDCPCYAIGALVVPAEVEDAFLAAFEERRKQHGVKHELKWNRIGKSHGPINFALDWMHLIRETSLTYNAIVVRKADYRKWSADREDAFYTTYSLLMSHLAGKRHAEFEVYIDQRQDRYAKHDEAVEIITNRMLAQVASRSKIESVTKSDSKLVPGIQIADVLTGAINASHREYLVPSFALQRGKRLLISRLAAMLGWDALWYDTWPNVNFNIWHFPTEYRAKPATRDVEITDGVPFVNLADLQDEE